jgi:hypothetical protein
MKREQRLVALINRADAHPPSRHYLGMPAEVAGGAEPVRLGWPRAAVITRNPSGIFLFRIAADGSVVGDTWHESFEAAKAQAEDEYGGLLGPWQEVPQGTGELELIAFAERFDAR